MSLHTATVSKSPTKKPKITVTSHLVSNTHTYTLTDERMETYDFPDVEDGCDADALSLDSGDDR